MSGRAFLLVILILLIAVGAFLWFGRDRRQDVSLDRLVVLARNGEISRLEVRGNLVLITTKTGRFQTFKEDGVSILTLLQLAGVPPDRLDKTVIDIRGSNERGHDWALTVPYILLSALVLLLAFYLYKLLAASRSGDSMVLGFGKWASQFLLAGSIPETKFQDVAGYAKAKRELQEIVDYLTSPAAFEQLGTEIPRNTLLVGPPGVGKTMLARAVANSAGVPFFPGSGAEFVEMFVGVGASRVRDLFVKARARGRAVVFIDEIDAVARKRATALLHTNMEHDQTLNELLIQLDGFLKDSKPRIVFIAATNREDILDAAFVQRMNRRIVVDLPDSSTRREIIGKLTTNRVFQISEADLCEITAQTAGLSGREITNLLMEASRQAYQRLLQDDAEAHCMEILAGSLGIVSPHQGETVKSPVRLSGFAPAGAAITVAIGKTVRKVSDNRSDGSWRLMIGLGPGDVKATVTAHSGSGDKLQSSVEFTVSDEIQFVEFEDVRAALQRSGLRIPLPSQILAATLFLDSVVTGQRGPKDALVAAAHLHYVRARVMVDANEEV